MSDCEKATYEGINEIFGERIRQVKEKGYSVRHDQYHKNGEMILLAACYILKNYKSPNEKEMEKTLKELESELYKIGLIQWLNYKNHIKNLVRAGALIAAEIDRVKSANF